MPGQTHGRGEGLRAQVRWCLWAAAAVDIRVRGLVRGPRLLVTLSVGNPRAPHTADMGEAWRRCLDAYCSLP